MIIWFSGTGNSRYVAEQLAPILSQELRRMAPDITRSTLSVTDGSGMIIWICPVYSWGIPPYVSNTIRNIDIDSTFTHHLILTCGDDCGLAAEMWRKDIAKRNWNAGNAYSIQMPNNYVCMKGFDVDSQPIKDKKLSMAPKRIAEISASLANREKAEKINDVTKGNFPWIKTKIIYPWFIRHAMSPSKFHHTKNCISCGRCAAVCPTDNISLAATEPTTNTGRKRRYPIWGKSCAGCLACYHVCPRHAVMYGNKTIGKGQYLNPITHTRIEPDPYKSCL